MTKYVVAILIFVALLAGLLLYIGDDASLLITSSAEAGLFRFNPIEISWQAAIVIFVLCVIGLLALWTFLGFLRRLPGRIKSGAGLRRRNKALDAMEEALIAGAQGDPDRARRKAETARNLIQSPALGQMVSALAAEACGDRNEAIHQYRAMLGNERTLAPAQRGLAQQLLATGDLAGAIEHAGAAYDENKNARWAFETLFQAQVADHRWKAAIDTIDTAYGRKHIEKDRARRRKAVLETAYSDTLETDGNHAKALDYALRAVTNAPEFAPAAAMAARLLGQEGDTKKAISTLEKSWERKPHPALALAFRDLTAADTPRAREKKIGHLVRTNPDHRESVILKAEEALAAGDAVSAWSELSPLMQQENPSERLCLLAAQIENTLNNPADAALWTQKAATAPAEADWSDLDPKGAAFEYDDQDWHRLVFSFGDEGSLIHPRFERGEAIRSIVGASAPKPPVISTTPDPENTEVPHTPLPSDTAPGGLKGVKDDIAMRLDNLLGDKNKS